MAIGKRRLRPAGGYYTSDLAHYLGVPLDTVRNWLKTGALEEPARHGRRRFWTEEQAREIKSRLR
jgi:predicted site-specific integrase-resolvase